MCLMTESNSSIVYKVKTAAAQRGKTVTDEEAREAIAREYNEFVIDAYNPTTPAPDVSRAAIDRAVDYLFEL
jgi:hypothetical protein